MNNKEMKKFVKTARKLAKPFRITDGRFRLKDIDPDDTLEFTSEDKPRAKEALATLALFAVVVASRVYRPGPVTRERIQGSVAVYLLLGLTWASAYELLHILRPGAWTGAASEAPVSQTCIYYSFVTLTTMGYGDITPVHPVARSLAILEALTGQLFLAITLARLVALHIKSGEQR